MILFRGDVKTRQDKATQGQDKRQDVTRYRQVLYTDKFCRDVKTRPGKVSQGQDKRLDMTRQDKTRQDKKRKEKKRQPQDNDKTIT